MSEENGEREERKRAREIRDRTKERREIKNIIKSIHIA